MCKKLTRDKSNKYFSSHNQSTLRVSISNFTSILTVTISALTFNLFSEKFSTDKNHALCGNINTFQLVANQAQCVANQITKPLDKLL